MLLVLRQRETCVLPCDAALSGNTIPVLGKEDEVDEERGSYSSMMVMLEHGGLACIVLYR